MKKLISIIMVLALCLTAFAACGTDESLVAAGDYLFNLYKNDATVTPSDFEVAGRVMVDGVLYTVDWTVDSEEVTIKASEKDGFYLVDINEKTEAEVAYTLTASIKNEAGKSVEKTFARTIPAYKVFSYAEYAAAEDDSTVVVKGVVAGIFSKSNGSSGNGIYIQDEKNEGGYYVYGLVDAKDPEADLGIKVGMTIEAAGTKDTYNGMYEVVNAAITILDSTIKEVTPVDYTEIYKNAEKLSDAALVDRQAMLVTIKGAEITGQETASGYYKFSLGGKESYIRISSSNNCITKDEQAAFIAAHTENFGYTADITGIVSLYSGNFYLVPADANALANFKLPERSASEKLEMEVGTVEIAGVISENTTIALPQTGATYSDVTYAWTSDNENAVVDGANLVVTVPEAPVTATLTLTATCGAETVTKTYAISLSALATEADVVNAAYALNAGEAIPGKYTLSGVITAIDTPYSEQYGNITVTIVVGDMSDKPIMCYRLKGEGAADLAVGDNITVTGAIKNFKGTVEFDSGCTLDAAKSAAEIVDEAYALAENTAMEAKCTLTGVITTIDTPYSEQYGNITVTIQVGEMADKAIMCYRLKGEGAAELAVGQTITVYGKIKNFKGTVEFDSGCVIVPTVAAAE